MKPTKEDVIRARESLAYLKPGDTVYTIIRHVSRSGMQRQVSLVTIQPYGDDVSKRYALHPNYSAALLIGARLNRDGPHDAIVRNGCGYDVAADTVQCLSRALFDNDYALRHEAL